MISKATHLLALCHIKKTALVISFGLALATQAAAQAPVSATVLASQPNMSTEVVKGEPVCVTVKLADGPDASDNTRMYMGVGAVLGGAIVALATTNLGTGLQLAATGAGVLAGGYAGKKVAERKSGHPVWSFADETPAPMVTPVPVGAGEATSCHVEERTRDVQRGYISLVRVRDKDEVVLTATALMQGATIRVYINPRGGLELVN